jgi:hypothetical protein
MIEIFKKSIKNRLIFVISFLRFNFFLKKINISNDEIKNKHINTYVIIVSPWSLTSTPWFAITLGLLLHKRNHKIQFLIDDLQYENTIDHKLQINLIRISFFSIRKLGLKIEKLSDYVIKLKINDNEKLSIKKLAFANAVHKNKGEENTQYFHSLTSKNEKLLCSNFPFIKSFIEDNFKETYIFAGGIYANSGLFEFLLKNHNRKYFTFDSGFEVLLSTYKGIAAQFSDIPTSLDLLLSENNDEINSAIKSAFQEFEMRKNGTNKLNSQYQSFELSENFDEVGMLIPLNSPWDSAALNITSLFTGYNEWLIETIECILKNSNYNITIRQHPDERFWWGRTKTDFNKLINNRFSDKRIQFVSCYDKVNTYSLLMKSKAVICYSSTFGIEASMAGKKVCVCSNVYYSTLGFTYKPTNIETIKYYLRNIDSNNISMDTKKASLTYYLGQQCNWLFTPFTPMTSDLNKWLKMGFENISQDVNVNIYLKSLEDHIPMSYLNHKRKYAGV